MRNVHEVEFVGAFVPAVGRERVLRLLERRGRGIKDRHKFSNWISHRVELDPRFGTPIPHGADLGAQLRAAGAPDVAWVVASTSADATEMPLDDAVAEIWAGDGVIVSCIPGRLAVYGPEQPGERLLLQRLGRPEGSTAPRAGARAERTAP